MIRKILLLAALCFFLVSCNNIFLKLSNKDLGDQAKFIVIFDKNGGDTEAFPNRKAVIAPETTVVNLPISPARTGYSFTGWNTSAVGSLGEEFKDTTPVNKNCTVYAQWDEN